MTRKALLIWALAVSAIWFLHCLLGSGGFTYYGFITGNLFLAAIPIMLGPVFRLARQHLQGLVSRIAQLAVAAVWLLFLPNAFYVLTDFMHLNTSVLVNARGDNHYTGYPYVRGDGMYALDTLMLFGAAAFGAYVGGLALLQAYRFMQRHVSASLAQASLGLIMLLSAIGVYIGRFGRWNSWEGLLHPWRIISDLADNLSSPARRQRFALVLLTMVIFEILSFYFVRFVEEGGQQRVKRKS